MSARTRTVGTALMKTLIHTHRLRLQHANSKTVPYRSFPDSPQPSPPVVVPSKAGDPSQANRCLSQSNAEKCLFFRPGRSTFWRCDNIGPSASHPTITTAPAPPHTPRPPRPTHTHPTPTHAPRTLPASPQPSPPIGPSASHPTTSTAPAPPHTPHPPHSTHTHPTPTHPPRTFPASPQPSAPIGLSASHPTICDACTPHPPHPPHPTHNDPTPTYRYPPLTHPTHPTPPTPTLPSRTPRTPVSSLSQFVFCCHASEKASIVGYKILSRGLKCGPL